MKYHKWLPKDIEFLREARKSRSIKDLANHFGVSEISLENILRKYNIKGDHWTIEDNNYLKEYRLSKSLTELADYFKTTEIAVQRQCARLGIKTGKQWKPGEKRNVGRKKGSGKPKIAKVVSIKNDNIEKLWQQQKRKNASRIKRVQSINRDYSTYRTIKLSNRTTLLVKPEANISAILELYKSKQVV